MCRSQIYIYIHCTVEKICGENITVQVHNHFVLHTTHMLQSTHKKNNKNFDIYDVNHHAQNINIQE